MRLPAAFAGLAIVVAAGMSAGCERSPSSTSRDPAPAPAPPPTPGPHRIVEPTPPPTPRTIRCCTSRRADLEGWIQAQLPARGMLYTRMGLGAQGPVQQTIVASFDQSTIHLAPWQGAPSDKPLSADQLRRLSELAATAWRGPAPTVTSSIADLRDTFVIADGDDVFYVSGSMQLDQTSLRDAIAALADAAGAH